MSAGAATGTGGVRLVRCPKCRGILPEMPNLQVYKCGGCGATLRAKKHKDEETRHISQIPPLHKNQIQTPDPNPAQNDLNNLGSSRQPPHTNTIQNNTGPAQENEVESSRNHRGNAFAAKELDSSLSEPSEQSQEIAHHYSDHAMSRDKDAIVTSEDDILCNNSLRDASDDNINSEAKSSSSLDYQLEQSQKTLHQDSSPGDLGDTTEAIDDSVMSEEDKLCTRLRDASKSPANRSSYAYDASISSSEGLDDQDFDQHSHFFRKAASFESRNASEFVDANDDSVNNKTDIDTDTDVQHQATRVSLLSFDGKQGPAEEQNQVKVEDSQGFRPVRRWRGLERDSGPSKFRYSVHAHDKMEYVENNQMELLKKVNELRDHLNRSYAPRGNENGQFSSTGRQHADPWHEYYKVPPVQAAGSHCLNAKNPWQPSTAGRPSKCAPYECGDLRTSFSGEVSDCIHRVGYSCCNGHTGRRQCSLQLPPPSTYHKSLSGVVGVHDVHKCNVPYISSQQQHLVDSTFHLQGYYSDPMSYDREYKEHKMKLDHRKRLTTIKRHYRPVAGGAPFVVCYSCSKLLHLPADFLLSKKRCHKLRCGSCSKLLMFSLSNNAVLPFLRNPTVPPPSEVESNSTNSATRRKLASEFHADDSYPRGSYGFSVPNSCSTVEQPNSSYVKPMEEEMLQLYGEERVSFERANMAKPSSGRKVTPRSSSPLHRLMGYYSASDILRGQGL